MVVMVRKEHPVIVDSGGDEQNTAKNDDEEEEQCESTMVNGLQMPWASFVKTGVTLMIIIILFRRPGITFSTT